MHTWSPYTEQRASWGTNKEFLTSSLKKHGACAHSGVVMSREELTLCARFLRQAMSCHLYTCTCKWWQSPRVCICGVHGANTTRLYLVGCGQSRQTRGVSFTEELKAEKGLHTSTCPAWSEHDLINTLHQHSLPSLLQTPVHLSLPITTIMKGAFTQCSHNDAAPRYSETSK